MKTKAEIRAEKLAIREAKKAEREAKKAARLEKQMIAKMKPVKFTPVMINRILQLVDPGHKFSEKKKIMVTKRIKQLGELAPRQIAARLKARQFQVDVISATFEEAKTAAMNGKKK